MLGPFNGRQIKYETLFDEVIRVLECAVVFIRLFDSIDVDFFKI